MRVCACVDMCCACVEGVDGHSLRLTLWHSVKSVLGLSVLVWVYVCVCS